MSLIIRERTFVAQRAPPKRSSRRLCRLCTRRVSVWSAKLSTLNNRTKTKGDFNRRVASCRQSFSRHADEMFNGFFHGGRQQLSKYRQLNSSWTLADICVFINNCAREFGRSLFVQTIKIIFCAIIVKEICVLKFSRHKNGLLKKNKNKNKCPYGIVMDSIIY